jgi:hypothetical protein
MTKDEFIKTCALCGYASKKVAREYAEEKDELTDVDFQEVWRINERQLDVKNGRLDRMRPYQDAKTTKRLIYGERI